MWSDCACCERVRVFDAIICPACSFNCRGTTCELRGPKFGSGEGEG